MIVGEIELYLASCFLSLVCVMFIYFPVRQTNYRSHQGGYVIACSTPYQNSVGNFDINVSRIHVRSSSKCSSTKKTNRVCRELFKPHLNPCPTAKPNGFLYDEERLLRRISGRQSPAATTKGLRQKGGSLRI